MSVYAASIALGTSGAGDGIIPVLIRTAHTIALVWPYMIAGSGLVVAGTCIGWVIGRSDSLPPVRWVAWWVTRVIVPLVRSRRWWQRAAAIFVNNATILGVVVAVSFSRTLPALLIALVGVSLGIGLRVLSARDELLSTIVPQDRGPTSRIQVGIGLALNLLELPAIVLAVGLSLGRSAASLPASIAGEAFTVWVVPMLMVGAAGEALWLGSIAGEEPSHPADASAPPSPHSEDPDR